MKYLRYIYEYASDEFIVGDTVKLRGIVDGKNIDGLIGIIDGIIDDWVHTNIRDGKIIKEYRYSGKVYYIKEIRWYVSPHNIIPLKNRKRIINPNDIYNEDDWGWKENDIQN